MLAKRIIPCLDCDLAVPGGRVVKGVRFRRIRYAGVPWELARRYSDEGADEIAFLDITASSERRETMVEVVKKTSEDVFVPLCVGGGIRRVGDFAALLRAGADKCAINTAAVLRPSLISGAARRFGSQCVVVAIDARRGPNGFEVVIYGGRRCTGIDALEWAVEAERRGAGEILLTSMDRDGTKDGFDIELTMAVTERVSIPVIASGGAGSAADFVELFERTRASAALAASIFHFNELKISEVKRFLKGRGIQVRL